MGIGLNAITSNTSSKLVQDSAFQVLSEGSLKAVARPAFTLIDNSASLDARKYSATKELIFQSVSMAMYFAIITTVFQKTKPTKKSQLKEVLPLLTGIGKQSIQKFLQNSLDLKVLKHIILTILRNGA